MATTRIMPLHIGKGRTTGKAISDIIGYVSNPEKTDGGRLISGYACDSRIANAEFLFAKQRYIAKTGRARGTDNVVAYQIRQSFVPGEITPEAANRIGCELARRFTKGRHAFVVCTHVDKEHIHNHIIWNSTNIDCDRKFRNFWGSSKAVRRLNDTICVENGLSIVESPKSHGKSYNKWLGDAAKPSHRELLRVAIDTALAQKPKDLGTLVAILQKAGVDVKQGKVLSLRLPGHKRFARLDTLGDAYSIEAMTGVFTGQSERKPRKATTITQQPKRVNLLVDIQAKLQAGKGAGYARWAKVFNLKQMAQTMNYLSEHGLLEYSLLAEKAQAATVRHKDLSAQIKEKEKRLAEIAVLKTQIINYVKTREVYAAYRKAGYSKRYYAEHETDILLHKAAKSAFDALKLQKLPTVKALSVEYAEVLAEKKALYGDYRQARDDMRELLTVKANVDRLLEDERHPDNGSHQKDTHL